MMQSNGAPDGRYLPPSAAAAAAAAAGMDYAAMDAHVAAAAHPHSHLDPHSAHAAALHYGLPPGHPAAGHHPHPPPPHPHHPHQQPHDLQTLHGPVPLVNQSHHSTQAVNKRSADSAGLDMMSGAASDSDEDSMVDVKPAIGGGDGEGAPGGGVRGRGSSAGSKASAAEVAASKKTRGRVKIKMEFIDNKLRRYTTFSKRKTGIMKKAYELSTLTGTQVMLLVASETGHVYTFATRKLQPMITSEAGKTLIQTCLNSPDQPGAGGGSTGGSGADQRMSATGYEETELTYNVPEDISAAEQQQKVRQMMYAANNHYSSVAAALYNQPPTSASHGGSQGSQGGGQPPSHSPYSTQAHNPSISPSPSPMTHYGGVTSLSPSVSSGIHSPGPHMVTPGSSHSPPFVIPHAQHQSVAGR